MADNSAVMADGQFDPENPSFEPLSVGYGISRTAPGDSALRMQHNAEGSWEHGLVVDSLYMHPNPYATEEADATVVEVTMTVRDDVGGLSQTIVKSYPISKALGTSVDYTTKRNTIYTLNVLVQSIDGKPDAEADITIQDWNAETIEVDVPWGEFRVDRTQTYVLRNTDETSKVHLMTIVSGPGDYPFDVTLVNADKGGAISTDVAQIYVDDAAQSGNTFSLATGTSAAVYVSAAEGFDSGWIKIEQQGGGVTRSLTRYIPVGGVSFSADDVEVDYTGSGSASFNIVSRLDMPDGTAAEEVPWEIEWVDEEGNPTFAPDWITGMPMSGTGSADGSTNYTFNIAQANQVNNPFLSATIKGSATSPYDLSTEGGTQNMNTANCYIVNAPGWYRLPLVYGNAIKTGTNNTGAYQQSVPSGGSGTTFMSNFRDHTGKAISQPYLYSAGYTVNRAELLWEDAQGLVADVGLDADKHYLTFQIPAGTIARGNALLAVFDASGRIMWSWHIWVTDYNPYSDANLRSVQNLNAANTFRMMQQNLGWAEPIEYEGRSQYVRITQPQTGLEVTILIAQPANDVFGTSMLYQWGRKDPFIGNAGVESLNKPSYGNPTYCWPTGSSGPGAGQSITTAAIKSEVNSNSTYDSGANEFQKEMAYRIRNPHVFITGNTSSADNYTVRYNLWSATNTVGSVNSNNIVKTVYDPSPRGFSVPPSGAYTGFTESGNNAGWGGQTGIPGEDTFNTDGTYDRGYNFYCNFNGTGETIFFPGSGYRAAGNGRIDTDGTNGCFWTASPNDSDSRMAYQGRYLDIVYKTDRHVVSPQGGAFYTCGFAIRCVKEGKGGDAPWNYNGFTW